MKNSTDDKKFIIEKIIKDSIFSGGELYQKLLLYLFQCYQENYPPTEMDIATHVFGKKKDFDPNEDTLIRVYLYRLRKKLDRYYAGSGGHDSIRLILPKGGHQIEFKSNFSYLTRLKGAISLQKIIIIFCFLTLFSVVFYLGGRNRSLSKALMANKSFAENSSIWSNFVQSDLKTSIVIGELFSFYINKNEYNHEWLIRDDQINSYDELKTFIKDANLDQSNIYLPGWEIVPKSSLSHLLKIYNILINIKEQIDVKITSEVSIEDIRNNNIIFIGHFHNLKHLKIYLPNQRFHPKTSYNPFYRHPERTISVTTSEIDTTYQFTFHYDQISGSNNDYVIVSKVPGPNNNVFLFIVSFLPLGRLETINMLTDSKLLPLIQEKIQATSEKFSSYFELLIEVKGYQEKGFSTKILHYFPLSSKHIIYE